jgi:hypothetical protein
MRMIKNSKLIKSTKLNDMRSVTRRREIYIIAASYLHCPFAGFMSPSRTRSPVLPRKGAIVQCSLRVADAKEAVCC